MVRNPFGPPDRLVEHEVLEKPWRVLASIDFLVRPASSPNEEQSAIAHHEDEATPIEPCW